MCNTQLTFYFTASLNNELMLVIALAHAAVEIAITVTLYKNIYKYKVNWNGLIFNFKSRVFPFTFPQIIWVTKYLCTKKIFVKWSFWMIVFFSHFPTFVIKPLQNLHNYSSMKRNASWQEILSYFLINSATFIRELYLWVCRPMKNLPNLSFNLPLLFTV